MSLHPALRHLGILFALCAGCALATKEGGDAPVPLDTEGAEPADSPTTAETTTRPGPAWTGIRRLTASEILFTLGDQLGVDLSDSVLLPEEPVAWGFDHLSQTSVISELLVERLDALAKTAAEAWRDRVRGEVAATYPVWTSDDPYGCVQDDAWTADRYWWLSWVAEPLVFPVDVPTEGTWLLSLDYFHRIALVGDDNFQLQIAVDGDVLLETVVQGQHTPSVLEVPAHLTAGPHQVSLTLLDGMSLATHAAYTGDTSYCVSATAVAYGDVRLVGPRDASTDGLTCHPSTDPGCVSDALQGLTERLWRRPLTLEEEARLLSVYTTGLEQGGTFDAGLALALRAMLLSPHFLLRPEPKTSDDIDTVGAWSLATRLSYLVWASAPDSTLRACAATGELTSMDGPCGLLDQLERLLADPRAHRFSERFAGQWLGIQDLERHLTRVGGVTDPLAPAMLDETWDVFEAYLDSDTLVATELVAAPFTWLRPTLARHYGMPIGGVDQSVRIDWADGERLGVLGHASVLAATSTLDHTAPVRRGAWVLDRLLCSPVGAPPEDIPALDPDLSPQDALQSHTDDPACAACHVRMDPLGLTLEAFDHRGLLRDAPVPPPLADGTQLSGPAELARWVSAQPEHDRCLAVQLGTYALGRRIAEADTLEDWQLYADRHGKTWRALLRAIVTSPSFTHRIGSPDAARVDVVVPELP